MRLTTILAAMLLVLGSMANSFAATTAPVPDAGSTALLLGGAVTALLSLRRRS